MRCLSISAENERQSKVFLELNYTSHVVRLKGGLNMCIEQAFFCVLTLSVVTLGRRHMNLGTWAHGSRSTIFEWCIFVTEAEHPSKDSVSELQLQLFNEQPVDSRPQQVVLFKRRVCGLRLSTPWHTDSIVPLSL